MRTGRVEAFSDGVLAIVLTIMVLEMKVPHGDSLSAILPLLPVLLSYILSFIYVGIYWNNHHHLFKVAETVSGPVLWANLHLLFWLSLVPFVTGWVGGNNFSRVPVALYGVVLLMAGVAYYILTLQLIRLHGLDSPLVKAIGNDTKGKMSILVYLVAIPLAFVSEWIACALYVVVAVIWIVPDRRLEKVPSADT